MPRRARLPLPRTEIEYLILADHVEALNGKLYMMGGGWDTIFVLEIGQPVPLSIACGAIIPYNETDEDHQLTLTVVNQDAVEVAPPLTVGFRSGRAPTLERGAATHVPFAINAAFIFPARGAYVLTAAIDSRPEAERRLTFHIKEQSGRRQ
jgi:hypothetical protein